MARTSTYECDNCGQSIPDPGKIYKLEVKVNRLENGTKYIEFDKLDDVEFELCPSCASNVKKAIQRVII